MWKIKLFLSISLSILFVNNMVYSNDIGINNNKIASYTFREPVYPIIYYPYPISMYQVKPVNPQYQVLFDPSLGWWVPIVPPRLPCPFDDRGGCRGPVGEPVELGGYTQYYFPQ